MKADLTRQTYQRDKHYARVIHQQGRVPIDADLNEQFAIDEHLDATTRIDMIGTAGVPKGPSFKVEASPDGKDLLLQPGTAYVDGILVETDGVTVPITTAGANVLQLDALTVAGRPLALAEWIEVSTPSGSPAAKVYRIRRIDKATRRITLGSGDNVPLDLGAVPLRLRRRPSYISQPDLIRPDGTTWPIPANPTLPLTDAQLPGIDAGIIPAGSYQVYLDVWERHITALEDPAIAETALGGADTCTRAKTVWQIKLRPVSGAPSCALPAEPARSVLRARAKLPSTGTNPCIIAPGSSYRRLENQLYRVEIHGGGTLTSGTPSAGLSFKFSRDNGTVVVRWLASNVSGDLTVDSIGRDQTLSLASGQWIELIDDERELKGLPGTLAQILTVNRNVVTIDLTTASGSAAIADFRGNLRIRRWDHVTGPALEVKRNDAVDDGYLELVESDGAQGVQVRFEDGAYRTGDYWLIPARTISADVEWPLDLDQKPIARAADGITHHRAALAVFDWNGTSWTPAVSDGKAIDCRKQFPPLTHICAEDVCVEDDPCGMGVSNVQDAIEKLCSQQNLPFHNKHLHGWGVVCGLQVNCCPANSPDPKARTKVTIKPGYAIHPTGVDINTEQDPEILFPVMQEAQALLDPNKRETINDIAVSLWIDEHKTVHVERYDPKAQRTAREFLEGTILLDFYDHCIQRVVDFLKDQTTEQPGEKGDQVTPTRKRIITFLNLFYQYFGGADSVNIYLSGEQDDALEGPNHEDKILRDFFTGLRSLLQSETFCAMFDDIVFPDYDVYVNDTVRDAGVNKHPFTLFGTNMHQRLRVHPAGKWAVTCDAVMTPSTIPTIPVINLDLGNRIRIPGPSKINVYDVQAGKMVAEVEFPLAGAEVKDVAFNGTNGIFAVAWIGDAKADSAVVGGTINADGTITWSQNQVTCSKKIVSLACGKEPADKLYAAARGAGVFVFDVTKLDPNPPQIGTETLATGHLVLVSKNARNTGGTELTGAGAILYAGFHTTETNPVAYDHIVGFPLATDGNVGAPRTFRLSQTETTKNEGHDDIAGLYDGSSVAGAKNELYVVVEGQNGGNKALVTFNGTTGDAVRTVSLDENTTNRLAYNWRTKQLFVSYEDSYKGRQYSPYETTPVLRPDRHPVQIGAVSVAVADDGRRWYVQNWASNTITVIPAEGMVDRAGAVLRQPWQSTVDPGKLQTYRDNVALAFLKVAGRFLQYLKDCFCELLLVKCPEEIGKIYLADVSFKDDKVYQICNFHRRHYVHSFRTIEYWMSVIPILPFLKFGVEKLCCSVITGFFDKLSAPRSNSIRISRTRSGLQWVSALNLASAVTTQRAQVGTAAALARTALNERLARPPAGTHPAELKGISNSEVVGATTDAVAENAARKDVTVEEVVVTDSGTTAASTLATSALKAGRIAPGSRIRLIADKSGRVLGYEAMDAAPKIDAARTDSAKKAAARGTGKPPRITPQPGAAPADTPAAAPGAPVPEVTRADLEALRAEMAKLRATPAPAAPTAAAPAPEVTKADLESLRAEVTKLRATPAPAAPAAPTVSKEDFDRVLTDLASVRAELAALKAKPPVR